MTPRNSPQLNKVPTLSATFSIRIQPRASKNEVIQMEGGGIKIRLTAPPVDGAANEALVKFLSAELGVPKSQVGIVSGHTSKNKIVRIEGVSQDTAEQLLNKGG